MRFTSGAKASTFARSDDDLFDKGLLCPHAHYFSGKLGEYEEFCHKYNIPDDVVLHHVKSTKIKDKREDNLEHITVPLMAVCEAGLQFPFHPFLREKLARFSLALHQLAINSYRIIMSIIVFIESHDLDFTVTDLFYTYTMSWHGKMGRPYLTTRPKKDHLIDGLSDTDKWADFYLEVHRNYEFGGTHSGYSISKIKDMRGDTEPFKSLVIYCLFCLYCC